jgi:flagellar biosynthesis/type III secretory pathway chaperone
VEAEKLRQSRQINLKQKKIMKANQLFNNSDVLALDQVQGGKGSITFGGKGGKDNWEVSASVTFNF